MRDLITLSSGQTAAQIEGGEDSVIDVQLPLTRKAYELLEEIDGNTRVVLYASDGPFFTGTVQDLDPDSHIVTIELT